MGVAMLLWLKQMFLPQMEWCTSLMLSSCQRISQTTILARTAPSLTWTAAQLLFELIDHLDDRQPSPFWASLGTQLCHGKVVQFSVHSEYISSHFLRRSAI